MFTLLWNALKASPVLFGAFFLLINSASAAQTLSGENVTDQTVFATEKKNTLSVESSAKFSSQPVSKKVEEFNLPQPTEFNPSSSVEPLPTWVEESKPNLSQSTSLELNPSSSAQQYAESSSQPLPIGVEASAASRQTSPTVSPALKSADSTLAQSTPAAGATTTESTNTLEQINQYTNEGDAIENMGQVTNVSQLRDVSPGDWAYEALRSLVERYGCIAGYPDGTFRGNRATTRYEFAAGLNACLQQVERLIASSTSDLVRRQDLETLQRLVQEFRPELTTLGTRLNTLEGRAAFLEEHQFSTTSKLTGGAVFAAIDAFGNNFAVPSGSRPTRDLDVNTIFAGRVELFFDTSFTGRDRLRVKLEGGNFIQFDRQITGTDMTGYDFATGPNNRVNLSNLAYRFTVGKALEVWLAASAQGTDEIAGVLNPAAGGFSGFGQRIPTIYRVSDGAGGAINYRFNDALRLTLAYLGNTGSVSSPSPDFGILRGQYGALAKLTVQPNNAFGLGLMYVHYYSPGPRESNQSSVSGGNGSLYAQAPFGDTTATSANSYGIEAQYRFSPNFGIGGWVGYTEAIAQSSSAIANRGDKAQIWNYAVTAGFPDLGGPGNLLGFIFGMPPRARGNDVVSRRDLGTSYHIEGFYQFRVSDNIALSPSLLVILNPEHNDTNDTIYVGAVRTIFNF